MAQRIGSLYLKCINLYMENRLAIGIELCVYVCMCEQCEKHIFRILFFVRRELNL